LQRAENEQNCSLKQTSQNETSVKLLLYTSTYMCLWFVNDSFDLSGSDIVEAQSDVY